MKKVHFLLAVVLVQCLCCLYAGTAISRPITLVTLGDSLTAGDGDSTGNGGYPSRRPVIADASMRRDTLPVSQTRRFPEWQH